MEWGRVSKVSVQGSHSVDHPKFHNFPGSSRYFSRLFCNPMTYKYSLEELHSVGLIIKENILIQHN